MKTDVKVDVKVRKAGAGDLPAIRCFVDEVLKEFGFSLETDVADDLEDLGRFYFRRGGDFEVVEARDGRILGTVAMIPTAPYRCELRRMYLAPELRGKGLGKYLMDRALGTARAMGFREVELVTSSSFTQAIGLYRRFGFYPVERGAQGGKFCDQAFATDL